MVLELLTYSSIEVITEDDVFNMLLGILHHGCILLLCCHGRRYPIEEREGYLIETYSTVSIFILPVSNYLLIPYIKKHMQLYS